MVKEPYQFFVSYKSGDVSFCRRFVERLRGSGQRTWFNEYDIRSDQQEEFQLLINEGIDRSQWGILVLGAGYTDSAYCNVEVERLLRRLPLERLIPIIVDGFKDKTDEASRFERMYPEIMARAIDVGSDDSRLYQRLHELGALPRPVSPVGPSGQVPKRFTVREGMFNFDQFGWDVKIGSRYRQQVWQDVLSYSQQRRTEYHSFHRTDEPRVKLFLDYEKLGGGQAAAIQDRMMASSKEQVEIDDRKRLRDELSFFRQEAGFAGSVASRSVDPIEGEETSLSEYRLQAGRQGEAIEEVGVHMYSLVIAGVEIKQRLFSFRLPSQKALYRVYKISFLHPGFNEIPYVARFAFEFPDDMKVFYESLPYCDYVVGTLVVESGPSKSPEAFRSVKDTAAKLFGR